MRLSIRHTTRYAFTRPIAHGLQRLRLQPKSTHGQRVIDWRMELEGARFEVEYDDHYANRTSLVSVDPGSQALFVSCTGIVETADNSGIVGPHVGPMPLWRFLMQTPLTRPGPRMRALASAHEIDRSNMLATLHDLSAAVLEAVSYAPGYTNVETPAEEAIALGYGVCQDHTHVFIGAARLMGIPARYVSGYLMMNDRVEQDAGHGWAEAHVDNLGWVAFDVSNGIGPDARYVRVASGCDYRDAAPITGLSFGGGQSELSVSVTVEQQRMQQ